MKRITSYIAVAALALSGIMSSCDDDFSRPPIVEPVSPMAGTENTTIAQFKELYWQDSESYATPVGQTADGRDIIIKARVISSDAASCLYQYLYVQDETGAMTIAARQQSSSAKLATQYGYGQEVYINATGLYAGRYSGLFQIGNINTDGNGTTFLTNDELLTHVSANGLGDPSKIDVWTITISQANEALKTVAETERFQAHAVRFENVHFTDVAKPFIATAGQDANITFADKDGNTMIIRMNRYCTFGNDLIPGGEGTITGELGYYRGAWQMVINSKADLEGFNFDVEPVEDGKPEGDGSKDNPFNSVAALEFTKTLAADATTDKEYYVKGKVTAVKEINPSFGNGTYTLTSEGTSAGFDIFRSLYLNGEKFTADDQLKVGDEVIVCGKLVNYKGNTPQMAQGGKIVSLNGNTGGNTPDNPETGKAEGDGSVASPFNSIAALNFATSLAADTPTDTEYYVKGKVTAIKEISTQFGNATYSVTSEGTTTAFDIFRGYYFNGDKFTSQSQLKVGDEVVVCGKLINYKGNTPQMNQGGKLISINGKTEGEGGDEDPNPPTPPSGDGVSVTGAQIAGCVSGTATVDGYSFTASKESGDAAPAENVYNGATTIRLYANNTLTIAGPAMAKIVFTINTATGARRYTTFTPNAGAVAEQKSGDAAITWTGEATSVTFTVGAIATLGTESTKPGQIHISNIEIIPVK